MTTETTKPRPIVVWLAAGAFAVVAAIGAYYYGVRNQGQQQEEVAAVQPQPAPGAEAPAAGEAAPGADARDSATAETPAAAPSAGPAEPRFDVLRVEKDGSTVVAGTAPSSSQVELLSGDAVIATTTAGPGGEFAIVLDQPLAKGDYALALRATMPGGAAVMSSETGVVRVPEEGGELMAMVTKEGEATRIMQAPETAGGEVREVETEEAAPEGAAGGEATAEAQRPAADEAAPAQTPAEQEVAGVEPAPAEPAPQSGMAAPATESAGEGEAPAAQIQPVLVKAVDVEGNRIFIAGAGEPGRSVNLYVDDAFVGATKIGPEGGFLLEATWELAPGNHEIRADMLAEDGSAVSNRAVVPLVHEVPETEIARAAPAAEPAPAAQPEQPAPAARAEGAEETPAAPAGETAVAQAEQPAASVAPRVAPSAGQPAAESAPAAATDGEAARAPAAEPAGEAGQAAQPAPTQPAPTQPAPAQPAQTQPAPARPAEAPAEDKAAQADAEMPGEKKVEPLRTGASVIIRRGDNLWRISRRMLGAGVKYTVIYDANRDQISDPHWIYPGQVFDVPGAIQEMNRN